MAAIIIRNFSKWGPQSTHHYSVLDGGNGHFQFSRTYSGSVDFREYIKQKIEAFEARGWEDRCPLLIREERGRLIGADNQEQDTRYTFNNMGNALLPGKNPAKNQGTRKKKASREGEGGMGHG